MNEQEQIMARATGARSVTIRKMILVPTRAGLIYECSECGERGAVEEMEFSFTHSCN
jgi:hypothetical protein